MHKTEVMQFRAPPELVEALAKAAEREGVSQSEIIRRAVAGRIGCEPAPEMVDPFERLTRAARGEVQAQRDLARMAVTAAFERDESGQFANEPLLALSEALVFARMAATTGEAADQGLVLSILALFLDAGGDHASATAEGIARVELAADSGGPGSEQAAEILESMVSGERPEVVALARDYLRRIRGAMA